MAKRYDMNCILDYVFNDNTDEECSGSDLDGESEDSDIDYESDVEIQPMFAQPVQEIIDNHLTLDDNDIYTTGIDKQQVEIARERNPVASNGSGDTPTHLMKLVILKGITMMLLTYIKH